MKMQQLVRLIIFWLSVRLQKQNSFLQIQDLLCQKLIMGRTTNKQQMNDFSS